MADPTKFIPSYDFSDFQASDPASPLPGAQVDIQIQDIKTTTDQIIEALKNVRRSDGALKNGIVTADSLASSLVIGFTLRGTWVVDEYYLAGDGTIYDEIFYKSRYAHTATAGSRPDLDPETWEFLTSLAAIAVADGALTPAKLNSDAAGFRTKISAASIAEVEDAVDIGVAAQRSTMPNLIVNGSMIDSQENGNAIGTTNGYFAADQFALCFTAATAAMSFQRIQTSKSLAGAANKLEFKTATAKVSLAASDFVTISQPIEGSRPDFVAAGWGAAGAKQFVYRHEMTLPAGLYHLHVQNSAGNRHITVPFTVAGGDANVAKVHEIIVPGDTSGTWLTADGTIGAVFDVVLAAGATLTGGLASTWGGTTYYAASTQFNILSSILNVARLADVGLRFDPDATGVYGAYAVGEVDAKFRSERYFTQINQAIGIANNAAHLANRGALTLPVAMAKIPVLTLGSYGVNAGSAGTVALYAITPSGVSFSNSAVDWTPNALVEIFAALSARLS